MTRPVPQAAIDFVKQQEGYKTVVYADIAGNPTGGWGHEITEAEKPNWLVGTPIPVTVTETWLTGDLADAVAKLYEKIKATIIESVLTENQWSALIDFAFNEGVPGTTIWQRLNAQQFDQVPAALSAFVYARVGGKEVKVSDLVRRRADEVKLWSTGEPGSVDIALSSSVTRNYATPAAPMDPKPRTSLGPAIATAATATAAAAPQASQAVKSISDAISPYKDASSHVAAALSLLALVAAGLAVLTLVLVYLRNKAVSRWEPTVMPSLPASALPQPQGKPDVQPDPAQVSP